MVYSLLGSNILEASATHIELTGLEEKNFLTIIFHAKHAGSGNMSARFRFNDSDSGYSSAETEDYGTRYTQVNDTNTENLTGTRTSGASMVIFHVINVSGQHHPLFSNGTSKSSGSGGMRGKQVVAVWNNTARITEVKAYIESGAEYGVGSYLMVYGSD